MRWTRRSRDADRPSRRFEALALFGSVLHGTAWPGSDVDLLVQFVPGAKTFERFVRLCELLVRLAADGGWGDNEAEAAEAWKSGRHKATTQ
jgi:predicted nucleotidyltransferase